MPKKCTIDIKGAYAVVVFNDYKENSINGTWIYDHEHLKEMLDELFDGEKYIITGCNLNIGSIYGIDCQLFVESFEDSIIPPNKEGVGNRIDRDINSVEVFDV